MTALSAAKKITRRDGRAFEYGLIAGVACYAGGLAMLVAGFARPARAGQGVGDLAKQADVATCQVVGVFQADAVGGAADGDVNGLVQRGCFPLVNSAGADEITAADIDKACYVVDDQTVARTSAGGTRPLAGTIVAIDEDGVWVEVGAPAKPRRSVTLPFAINETDTLAGTSAELVSPVAGEITRLSVIVQKAVTTGGDVTLANGVTAVDGLACTIADAAAKGTVVTDTPTAGHASTRVAAGGRIQVVPAAAFNTGGAVSGFVEIAY